MKPVTGKTVCIMTTIKTVSKMCKSTDIAFCTHAYAVKRMPNSLKSVLDSAVQIFGFVKVQPLNSIF
jgi:hypothetical protein